MLGTKETFHALSWIVVGATALALTAKAQDADVEAVLARMAGSSESLETIRADITQTKTYTALGIEDPPETGTLEVKRTQKATNVRLEFTDPETRILAVQDGRYVLYQPRIKQAVLGNASSGTSSSTGAFLRYLLGDLGDAREHFTVELVESGDETQHLRLTPKKPEEVHYRRIDLWVDDALGIPVVEELIEPNGDRIRIVLENVRLNGAIPDSRFEVELPDDVERVRS